MFEIYKALQQAMKLAKNAKNDEQFRACLAVIGLLSVQLSETTKARFIELDDSHENEEKLH